MRYTKCKCGNDNFEMTRNARIECTKCGQWQMPWSRLEFKVMKPNGRNWFYLILPPYFIQALDDKFDGKIDEDDLVTLVANQIHKVCENERNKVQAAKWNPLNQINKDGKEGGVHIYWKHRWNFKQKRLELELITLTNQDRFTTKFNKNVEFVTVNFNE